MRRAQSTSPVEVGPDERTTELLQRVQDAALDSTRTLADALRAAVAAAGKLGANDLREWATHELNGYDETSELPTYRTVRAPLLMDYVLGFNQVSRHNVDLTMLDEEVREWINDVPLRAGIAELSALAIEEAGGSVRMTFAAAPYVAAMIARNSGQSSFLNIHSLYYSVSRAAIAGVLDQVRTRLVDLVAEYDLQVRKPGVSPKVAAERALHITIGDDATVNLNAALGDQPQPTAGSAPTVEPRWWKSAWWTTWRIAWAGAVGLATIAAGWIAADTAGWF